MTDINPLLPKSLTNESSISEALKKIKDLQVQIFDASKILFATKLINYFHNNPDALLFIGGNGDINDGHSWTSSFISRIDSDYIRGIAMDCTIEDENTLSATYRDRSYSKNALDFNGDGDNYIKKDATQLPRNIKLYTLTAFDIFVTSDMADIWYLIGDYNDNGEDYSGYVYSKNDIVKLLSHFNIDHMSLLSQIESENLKNSAALECESIKINPLKNAL